MRFALALCFVLAACSADPILMLPDAATADTGPAQVCTPGAQVACSCVGGGSGAQVCSSDGRALGACDCPDAGSGVDVAVVDAGPRDVGVMDAGPVDTGQVDAGVDAGGDAASDVGGDRGPVDDDPCASCPPLGPRMVSRCRETGTCAAWACERADDELLYANCDGDLTNGCETDVRGNVNHCGYCNQRCRSGTTCDYNPAVRLWLCPLADGGT